MKTDGKRKARLEKKVATTQLRLALETEGERSKNGLDLIWIEIFFFYSRSEPALGISSNVDISVVSKNT